MDDSRSVANEYRKKFNPEGKNILLFVGRLVAVKNLNFLLKVFSEYVKINDNSILILTGEGDKKEELVKLTEQLNLQKHVNFAGRFENEELYAWYQIADYFILPSISEVFGAVVNEALIAGVPVLCSGVAGAACMINDRNGLIFNPYNKEELLSAFKTVLTKEQKTQNDNSQRISLMPYTFNQRITELISFLK